MIQKALITGITGQDGSYLAELLLSKGMDEEILIKKATAVLIKELGPVEAIRFINMPKKKRLESAKRHREWQELLKKDRFFNKVFGG